MRDPDSNLPGVLSWSYRVPYAPGAPIQAPPTSDPVAARVQARLVEVREARTAPRPGLVRDRHSRKPLPGYWVVGDQPVPATRPEHPPSSALWPRLGTKLDHAGPHFMLVAEWLDRQWAPRGAPPHPLMPGSARFVVDAPVWPGSFYQVTVEPSLDLDQVRALYGRQAWERAQGQESACVSIVRVPCWIQWDKLPLGQVSDEEIAQQLGVTRTAVGIARRRRGITAHRRPPSRIDWASQPLGQVSDTALARKLGCARSAVTRARIRAGVKLQHAREKIPWDDLPLGVEMDIVIAARMQVGVSSVQQARKRRGIPRCPRGPASRGTLAGQPPSEAPCPAPLDPPVATPDLVESTT